MTKQKTEIFYSYRYRGWSSNVYYGTLSREFSDADIAEGWGAWETIDEKKYNEILECINSPYGASHYQAEKIMCEVQEHDSFDPRRWIAERLRCTERDKKHLGRGERKTVYLAKMKEPEGHVTPWLVISSKEFETKVHRNFDDHIITVLAAQAHFGSFSDYQYNGTQQIAFEFHSDYADMEPKS